MTRSLTAACAHEGCPWPAFADSDRCQRHLLLDQGWHVRIAADGSEHWWRYGKRHTLKGAWRRQKGTGW